MTAPADRHPDQRGPVERFWIVALMPTVPMGVPLPVYTHLTDFAAQDAIEHRHFPRR